MQYIIYETTNLINGTIYNSMRDAADILGIAYTTLVSRVQSKRNVNYCFYS